MIVVSKDMYDESLSYISLPNSDFLGHIKAVNESFEAYRYLPQDFAATTGIKAAKRIFKKFDAASKWICSLKSKSKSSTNSNQLF